MHITRHSLVGIIFTGFLVLGIFLYFYAQPFIDTPARGTTVIAFGDSLIAGVGATEDNDLVRLLEKETGVEIINAGQSGDTTDSALTRLDRDVLARDPKVVIVLLGGNDALRRISREQTFTNLENIIDQIHGRGAAVILLGVRGGIVNGGYEKEFKRIAREKRVSYVSDILSGVFGRTHLMSDAIHPNDQGYAIMARRVAPILKKVLERS